MNLFKYIRKDEDWRRCDGCRRVIPAGESFLSGTGYRCLCRDCAATMFAPDGWGRETSMMSQNHVDPEC